jgi:hypothetical protein
MTHNRESALCAAGCGVIPYPGETVCTRCRVEAKAVAIAEAQDMARIPQELVSRVLALCSYVGDHGGGERARCTTGAERCPSCAANSIATELAEVAGMTYEQ